MRIESKQQMAELLKRGEFGWQVETYIGFNTIYRNLPRHSDGRWMLRYLGIGGCTFPRYGQRLRPVEVPYILNQWICEGADLERVTLSRCIDDDRILIQGEAMRTHEGLSLRWSPCKLPMRIALATEQYHCTGLYALMLLQSRMDNNSYEMLNHLLDKFDDAVVEFTTIDGPLTDTGDNTIFWEVRHY